jgi:hypothetical protein
MKRKRRLRQPKHLRDSMTRIVADTYVDELGGRSLAVYETILLRPIESRRLIAWLTHAAAWQAQQKGTP